MAKSPGMVSACSGVRVPQYLSFIRSIRIRYLSGLMMIAVAAAAIMFAMSSVNTYRRQLDTAAARTRMLSESDRFIRTALGL